MQRVIELARTIRERHSKSVKMPVREVVVVHPDQAFLDDLTGGWVGGLHRGVGLVREGARTGGRWLGLGGCAQECRRGGGGTGACSGTAGLDWQPS